MVEEVDDACMEQSIVEDSELVGGRAEQLADPSDFGMTKL